MNLGINLFKKAHGVDDLSAALSAFDQETVTLKARQTELDGLIENTLALVAVGEGDAKELKAFQAEAAQITGKLTGRAGARAKIAQELQVAEATAAWEARRVKIAEARAWQKQMDSASDELAAALKTVSERIVAVQRIDFAMPGFINTARPSICPAPVGSRLARFRFFCEPDQFGHAAEALEGEKRYLGMILDGIEAGEQSVGEHLAARMTMDAAPRIAS